MYNMIIDMAMANMEAEQRRSQAIFLGVTVGFFCGLVPLTTGYKNNKLSLGITGLVVCVIGGYWFGLRGDLRAGTADYSSDLNYNSAYSKWDLTMKYWEWSSLPGATTSAKGCMLFRPAVLHSPRT